MRNQVLHKIGNLIFFLGIAVCGLGLVYILGYSDHDFFMYSSVFGFALIAISSFSSFFEKPEKE